MKVLELSKAWQFTGEIWYLSLKREDIESGMRSTVQDATESLIWMGMRFDPVRVTDLDAETLWSWGNQGRRAASSVLSACSLSPCSDLLG